MEVTFLEVEGVAKSFGETTVLRDISLGVEEGETLVLLGQSGSGKTTLLRIIAGFETADRGEIVVGGQAMGTLAPAERNLGMVFQHYALFPHLSVAENVAFGLESRALSKSKIAELVERALERVDLGGLGARRIDAISGGQQQRVALARALAPSPRLLLLDEPLSNLDPELRERTRQELANTLSDIGITAVWVTHEQEEAFDVGTRVAVLNEGRLEQLGTPEELYRRPRTPFVAAFVGRSSVLRGRLLGDRVAEVSGAGGAPVRLQVLVADAASPDSLPEVNVYVRPEAWEVVDSASNDPSASGFAGAVVGRRFTGRENLLRIRLDDGAEIEAISERDVAVGDRLGVRLREASVAPTAFVVEREFE